MKTQMKTAQAQVDSLNKLHSMLPPELRRGATTRTRTSSPLYPRGTPVVERHVSKKGTFLFLAMSHTWTTKGVVPFYSINDLFELSNGKPLL